MHVEFVPASSGVTLWATDTLVDGTKSFNDAVLDTLRDNLVVDNETTELDREKYTVYLNRPPNTPFFPIAANERQIAAFRKSLVDPPHEPIDPVDQAFTMAELLEKYKIAIFTIYET